MLFDKTTAWPRQWRKRFCDRNGPHRQTAIARPIIQLREKHTCLPKHSATITNGMRRRFGRQVHEHIYFTLIF